MKLIVFLLPLIGANGKFGYEQIKVLFFILSISLIGFLNLKLKFKWTPIVVSGGIFVLILGLTSLIGLNPEASFLGADPYFQGLILYAYLYLFFLMIRVSNIKIGQWAYILAGSSGLVGMVAIWDWILLNIFHQQIPTYAGRVVSTFGQPNFYGGFLLLTLPFSYLLFKHSAKKLQLLGWGSGLISMIGIMVSYSKAAIFMALILLILGLIDQMRNKLLIALVVSLILILSISISFKLSLGVFGSELAYPLQIKSPNLATQSLEKRVYIWPILWYQVLKRPVFGYGLENIEKVFSSYKAPADYWEPIFLAAKDLLVNRSHNYVLDLLLFSGILGVAGWIILVMMLFKGLIQKYDGPRKNVLLVSLVTYLIWVQFQNQSIVHLVYFWLLAGLIDQCNMKFQKIHFYEV